MACFQHLFREREHPLEIGQARGTPLHLTVPIEGSWNFWWSAFHCSNWKNLSTSPSTSPSQNNSASHSRWATIAKQRFSSFKFTSHAALRRIILALGAGVFATDTAIRGRNNRVEAICVQKLPDPAHIFVTGKEAAELSKPIRSGSHSKFDELSRLSNRELIAEGFAFSLLRQVWYLKYGPLNNVHSKTGHSHQSARREREI